MISKLNGSFFVGGHRKGAVDVIGGNVKCCVWMGVKSRRVPVLIAKDFHAYVQKHVKLLLLSFTTLFNILGHQHRFRH